MNRWMNRRHECASGGKQPDAKAKTSGLCAMGRHASCRDPNALLSPIVASSYCGAHLCCARILLSVLRTLLHGAFQWLQPRSPVVEVVVERGRGPNPPDARADAARSREESVQAPVSLQARGGRVQEKPPPVARADGNPLRGKGAAVAGPVVGRKLPWRVLSGLRRGLCIRQQTWASARSILLRNSSRIAFSLQGVRQPLSSRQRLPRHGRCALSAIARLR